MSEKNTLMLARLLMTPLFLYSGIGKVFFFDDNVIKTPFGDSLLGQLMIAGAIVIEIGGSLMFLFGYRLKVASSVWIAYVIITALMFHHFWTFSGAQQVGQIINFTKNLSICAGLIYIFMHKDSKW